MATSDLSQADLVRDLLRASAFTTAPDLIAATVYLAAARAGRADGT